MHEKFIARQPIFDHRLKIFGYELLFRGGPKNVFEPHREASSSVIVDSVLLFDLQALTGSAKAFINVDAATLLRGAVRLLPPEAVVVEILEHVDLNEETLKACKELRSSGYALALDDFLDDAKWQPVIPLVTCLKVDFRAADHDLRRAIARKYQGRNMQLLAEKVETQAELDDARSLGYGFFQGFFFCKPAMVSRKDIPANKINYLQLLQAVSCAELVYDQVERIMKREPSLVYKLLRYLNSPLLGCRSEIRGIREALALLGDAEFRRWVSIIAMVAMATDKPHELIRTALTRGYFSEEISRGSGLAAESSDLFLMGLLSVVDAILDRPMEQALANLPVSAEVRAALCGGKNRFRDVYDIVLAYEQADWDSMGSLAKQLGAPEEKIPEYFLSASHRAQQVAV